jgi:hypothetical protein
MNLKEKRINLGLTQNQVSQIVGIPLRTYKNYENDIDKEESIKYNYIMEKLDKFNFIDEETGILTIDKIADECRKVFEEYTVEYCYLFGSYSTGKAQEKSDVDLLLSANINGLDFFGLVEKLRLGLHKKVDLLLVNQLENNIALIHDILRDGIKIYG